VSKGAKDTVAAYYGNTGKAIKRRREQLKMTQEELADKSGLPQSHISRLEAGKHAPTRQTIERVAKALKIEPGKLDLLYD
jgi:transcriptional regulator with XRE-family HTH domain